MKKTKITTGSLLFLLIIHVVYFYNYAYALVKNKDELYSRQYLYLKSQIKKDVVFERKYLRTISINISDNIYDEYLIWQKKAHVHKILWENIPSFFSKTKLISCIQNHLFLEGFLEATVDFNPEKEALNIFFGNKYSIYGISLKTPAETPETILDIFKFNDRKISVASLLEKKQQSILFLKKHGYLDSKVDLKIIKNINIETKKPSFNAEITIHLGHLAKFGKINFTGSYNLSKTFLKKLLPFSQGDLWDSNKVYLAKKQLESTGIFSTVEITCSGSFNKKERKNNLKEKDNKCFSIPIEVLLKEDLRNEIKFIFGIFPKKARQSFFGKKENDLLEKNNNFLLNGINFYNQVEFSKYNIFSAYDKIHLVAGFDIEKKFIQFNHEIGFLKNLPVESEISLLFESDNSILQNKPLGYGIVGIQNSLSKRLNNHFLFKNTSAILFGEVTKKNPSHQLLSLKYLQLSPSLTIDNISGNWFEEKGFSLFNSIGLSLSLKNNKHIFSTELFLTTLIPLFSSLSIACRIGTILQWPMNEIDNMQKDELNNKISSLVNNQHREKCFDDFIFMNDHNKRNSNIHQLFNNYINPSKKDFFYSFEARKLLLQNFGVAIFTNIKVKDFLTSSLSVGSSFRYKLPVGTLFFNLGWNSIDKSCFWQIRLGEVSF